MESRTGNIMRLRGVISLLSTIAAIFMGLAATAAAPSPTIAYTTKNSRET